MILHLSQRFFTDAWTFISATLAARPATLSRFAFGRWRARRGQDYLCSQTIRPRPRSYGVISTVTLSPGMMRMYLIRIFPQT